MTHRDIQKKFVHFVYESIFENGEARTLSSLTNEYKRIRLDFGIASEVRSSTVKEMLSDEFGDKIGFHERFHKNKSMIVFNRENTGNYIESAINFWGISTDELLRIAAKRIKKELSNDTHMQWPAKVSYLTNIVKETEKPPDLIQKFLFDLTKNKDGEKNRTKVMFLRDAIQYLVTGKKTLLLTCLSVIIHGLTRSKEIVKFMSACGVGISYDDLRTLFDAWTYDDVENGEVCPDELAIGKPGTAIIDNDDFKDDSLTGETSHRTNMMFIQPERFIKKIENNNSGLKRCSTGELKEIVEKQHEISDYRSTTRGAPKPYSSIDTSPGDSLTMRMKLFAHSIVRCKEDGSDIPPDDQTIGAFSGFMASISEKEERSKPYFFSTLPKGPSKNVVYTLMEKAVNAALVKNMPFIHTIRRRSTSLYINC